VVEREKLFNFVISHAERDMLGHMTAKVVEELVDKMQVALGTSKWSALSTWLGDFTAAWKDFADAGNVPYETRTGRRRRHSSPPHLAQPSATRTVTPRLTRLTGPST
jgi:hypothetical protein